MISKRESRARVKLFQENHMKNAQQRSVDKHVRELGLSYAKVYKTRREIMDRVNAFFEGIIAASRAAKEAAGKIQAMAQGRRTG